MKNLLRGVYTMIAEVRDCGVDVVGQLPNDLGFVEVRKKSFVYC